MMGLYPHNVNCVLAEQRFPLLCPFDINIYPILIVIMGQTECLSQSLQQLVFLERVLASQC